MAKPYRVNTFVRINNTIIISLLRLGIKMWSFSLLTVRGRKSGKPIVTPLAIFVQDQKRYLIATYGVVNWVRNIRAAGGEATLTRRRHSEQIRAIELSKNTAALVFRAALRSGSPGVPAVIFRVYRALLVLCESASQRERRGGFPASGEQCSSGHVLVNILARA
jgi:deazaflavin-dependent oxidoreductase (nitroreductase family)